jgi:hypothetical protein
MATDDTRPRVYHMANLVSLRGKVSPLCAAKPRVLNLKRHQLWTIRWEAVNCPRCLALKPKQATKGAEDGKTEGVPHLNHQGG